MITTRRAASAEPAQSRAATREPFRLLFPLGAAFGCVGVGHWLAYALGWTPSYSGAFHASIQSGAFLACFIAGFLMTALPRFTAAPQATRTEVALALSLIVVHAVAAAKELWTVADATFGGLLVLLGAFGIARFVRRAATRVGPSGRPVAAPAPASGPPLALLWVPLSLALGAVGAAASILGRTGAGDPFLARLGKSLTEQGVILGLVAGVGSFLIPRVLGRAAIAMPARQSDGSIRRAHSQKRIVIHAFAATLFGASFLLEAAGATRTSYGARAVALAAVFAAEAGFHRIGALPRPHGPLLFGALWMTVLGLAGVAVWPSYRVALLHATFLGGLSTMIFTVATVVVWSHTPETLQPTASRTARSPWAIAPVVGAGMGLALVGRIAAEFAPGAFFTLLGAAAACWIVAALIWLAVVTPRVLRFSPEDSFAVLHEEAKRRVGAGSPFRPPVAGGEPICGP